MERPNFKHNESAIAYLSKCLDNIKPQKRYMLEWFISAMANWNVKRNDIKASHRVIGARVRPDIKPNSQRVFSQRAMSNLCIEGVLTIRSLTNRGVNVLSIRWNKLWSWLKKCGTPSPKKCGTNNSYKNKSPFFDLSMLISRAVDAQRRWNDALVDYRVKCITKPLRKAGIKILVPPQRKAIDAANKAFEKAQRKSYWRGPTTKGIQAIDSIKSRFF
ncbi:hypothetical protein [Vibrio parahaemolyticus]|uniref:hypothetical protein n=1 Tax=Vibrio parahaemolyticus TaxID=670 RepID=UPI000C9B914E|nr:hypothetical protein [Vibrio parahaemolyticus]PMS91960.1 hypothetical protein C1T06_22990 [Vibrio parahaemolyticus]